MEGVAGELRRRQMVVPEGSADPVSSGSSDMGNMSDGSELEREDSEADPQDSSKSSSSRWSHGRSSSDGVASLQRSLQSLCSGSMSRVDLLSMPGRALDRAEEMARHAWEAAVDPRSGADLLAMPARALDKAEEMARQAWGAVDPLCTAELLAAMPGRALDRAEEMARHAWTAIHHANLPQWLRDNDCLIKGHRPPLNSFVACFKSIFRIHTETGNIWTHLVGFVAFIVVTVYFWTRPSVEVQLREKAVFSAFFAGAILCLGFSWLFHTLYCHSEKVGRIFCKLDYCGIALLIVGSFVPWLYYCFYCDRYKQTFYTVLIIVMGTASIFISMCDKFAEPRFRPLRAGVFILLGLSGVIPAAHYIYSEGFYHAVRYASFGWLILMAVLYISGATIYACRIPECLWPGKFDIWFSSHQIFHVFVVAAAFIHYHGVSEVARNQMLIAKCVAPPSSFPLE